MANKRQRKKAAKKALGRYEGQQYKGGRSNGSPNLKRTASGFINQYGVEFTQEQKKALERAVGRSNYQRQKQQKEADRLNPNNSQLRLMGKESDFIISRQSKSLQQFKSMEDFEKFMGKQSRIQSGEYLEEKTRLYKRNYMKALKTEFGKNGAGMAMKVRMMDPVKFRELIETHGDDLEIGYVYGPEGREKKFHQIRNLLGMPDAEFEVPLSNEER